MTPRVSFSGLDHFKFHNGVKSVLAIHDMFSEFVGDEIGSAGNRQLRMEKYL